MRWEEFHLLPGASYVIIDVLPHEMKDGKLPLSLCCRRGITQGVGGDKAVIVLEEVFVPEVGSLISDVKLHLAQQFIV